MAGSNPLNQLAGKPGQNAEIEESVQEAIRLTGPARLADMPVADATTGGAS